MKPLFKYLNFHIFKNTLLTVLFTIPQIPLVGGFSSQKVLAQQQTSCPAGTVPVGINWTQTNNLDEFLQQNLSSGRVRTTFNFTESNPGRVLDRLETKIDTTIYGGITAPHLEWNIGPGDPPEGGNVAEGSSTLTITFAQPVTLANPLVFLDVDQFGARDRTPEGNKIFQDQITITASNGNSPVGVTLRALGPYTTVNGNVAKGANENAFREGSQGNLEASFASPVTQIRVVYQPGPDVGTPPRQDQTIGLALFTVCAPTVIGDRVFIDRNSDRISNQGEPGIADVTVTLRNSTGEVVGTTRTDQNGNYLFTSFPLGNYTVEVTRPSDFTATTDTTLSVNLTEANPENLDIDFGFRPGRPGASGEPNLRLVKRITNATSNGQPISGVSFNTFVNDPDDDDDDAIQQTGRSPVGQISLQPPLESGDEVEYTIYFLVDGGQQLENARFCDLIPAGTSYVPNSLSVNGISNQGQVLSPLAPLQDFANTCGGSNNKGAVVVGPVNIPDGQSGLIRFRVTID